MQAVWNRLKEVYVTIDDNVLRMVPPVTTCLMAVGRTEMTLCRPQSGNDVNLLQRIQPWEKDFQGQVTIEKATCGHCSTVAHHLSI